MSSRSMRLLQKTIQFVQIQIIKIKMNFVIMKPRFAVNLSDEKLIYLASEFHHFSHAREENIKEKFASIKNN